MVLLIGYGAFWPFQYQPAHHTKQQNRQEEIRMALPSTTNGRHLQSLKPIRSTKASSNGTGNGNLSIGRLLSRGLIYRFSHHPERYLEILAVFRKYKLSRVFTQLGLEILDIEKV